MKINLIDKQLLDLDGNALPGGIMSNVVSDMLATSRTGDDPIKLYNLAKKIKKGEADLDPADLELVEKIVRAHEGFVPLTKAQILEELIDQRLAGKAKK